MNKILEAFPYEKIKRLFVSDLPDNSFMVESDLTMVFWPLQQGEREKYNSPIAPKGTQWVVVNPEYEEQIIDILK